MTGRISEAQLRSELKSGNLSRVYFLYGEEDFLIHFFRDRIIEAAVPEEFRDLNFIRYRNPPKADEAAVFLDSIPIMSEYKCVLIEDLDPDSLNDDDKKSNEQKAYLSMIENVPETSVLIICQEHIDPMLFDPKKGKAKPKKLLAAAEKVGVSVKFDFLPEYKVAEKAVREISKAGCTISSENAQYLAKQCERSLTVLRNEIKKLCSYRQTGEITREDIDFITPKPVNASVYSLAEALFAGRTANAYEIINDLILQQYEPHAIFAALTGHFVDLYHAKLGQLAKKNYSETAAAFRYPPNRSFILQKAYGSVKNLDIRYLNDCITVLYRTNKLLNSSKADRRTLVEQAIADIATLKK